MTSDEDEERKKKKRKVESGKCGRLQDPREHRHIDRPERTRGTQLNSNIERRDDSKPKSKSNQTKRKERKRSAL